MSEGDRGGRAFILIQFSINIIFLFFFSIFFSFSSQLILTVWICTDTDSVRTLTRTISGVVEAIRNLVQDLRTLDRTLDSWVRSLSSRTFSLFFHFLLCFREGISLSIFI